MKLQPGTQLRQYRIVETIGAGGMGEVYRARDTNLERDVAVKVLPVSLAENPIDLARLEREAKSIAALSHPNILAVYDFGTENGTAFLVIELLEGETLRERLAQGALPPRKATEIGRQIARGLAAAHDKGIVHRDLKPDNIFLTGEGRVKILDFGLATAGSEPDAAAGNPERVGATITNLTMPGTVLGTVDYMSPEQVRGLPTDNRSDLFSFGSVFYEMVGGVRPFHRETHAETMTAILREDPPELATLAADLPPALAAIIRRCLEKHPAERFHSAHDLAFSLEALSGSAVSTGTAAALADVSLPRRRPGLAVTAVLLLIGLLVGAAAATFLRPAAGPDQVVDFLDLSSRRGTVTNARFVSGNDAAIYSASWEGGPLRLYSALPGSRTSEPMSIGNADLLSVSPTGELAVALDRRYPAGWEAIGTLAIAQPGGAAPRQILENVQVADWAPDGRTLAVAHEVGGKVRLEFPIGTVLYESPGWISSIRVNSDGNRVLFADCPVRGDNTAPLKVIDRQGKIENLGVLGGWGALWAPDGETIWYSGGGAIKAVQAGREPRLMLNLPNPVHLLDVSASGEVLTAITNLRRDIIGRAPGASVETNLSWQDYSTPSVLSDDGRLVVFEEGNDVSADGYAIYLRGTDGSAPLQLGAGSVVALSPDAKWVALLKRKFSDHPQLVLVPTGPGEPRPLDIGDLKLSSGVGVWLKGQGKGDSGSLLLPGQQGSGPLQLFQILIGESNTPLAITPQDLPLSSQQIIVSPDGQEFIVMPAEGPPLAFDFAGSDPNPVKGLEATDQLLNFDGDGKHVYVLGSETIPAPIYRVDLDSGSRSLWVELAPSDRAGVLIVDRVRISPDGAGYVYSTRRLMSSLQSISGLR